MGGVWEAGGGRAEDQFLIQKEYLTKNIIIRQGDQYSIANYSVSLVNYL